MIVVPPEFAAERVRRDGDAARRWLDALPARIAPVCARWGVELDGGRPLYGDVNLVLPARRGDEPCVLKVCWPEHDSAGEASALRAWAGRGAVRLLDACPSEGLLLLERLDPDRSLRDLDLLPAAEIAGGLIRELCVPAPEGLPVLTDIATEIAETAGPRQRALGHPLPGRWVERAASLARDLAASAGTQLVHADLHYGNVLASTRRPWLAIDPKAVAGDPEYSVPELMWTRVDDAKDAAAVHALLGVLVEAGDLDHDKARSWTVVRAVDYWLWALGVGFTEDPLRCRRLVETLA